MKIFEIITGLHVPISNEEYAVLKKINEEPVKKASLAEREVYLANQLVIRDLLTRKNINGEIHYKLQAGTRKIQ
jgi:hypothetical protein